MQTAAARDVTSSDVLPDRRPLSPGEDRERERLLKLWLQLDSEYMTWCDTHRDIIDFIQPNRGAFWQTDTNRGTRKDSRVVNNTAQDRARKLAAAMDVGITSEAREWFVIGVEDPTAADDRGVREYCYEYQRALMAFISQIGWYAPNRNVLEDVVGPAIGLMLIEEDSKAGARCTHVPLGQYRVGCDSTGEVNIVARRFVYTAEQMVEEFGLERVSGNVRRALTENLTQVAKYTVIQIIEERRGGRPGAQAKRKPWASTWIEVGQGMMTASTLAATQFQSTDGIGPLGLLRESGYDECPFYVPRWNQIGQNAYGTDSPGWVVLSDTQSLQDLELGGATMLAKIMDPPMNEPASLKNASSLPGARNPLPDNARVKFEPSYELPPEGVTVLEKLIARFENRINQGCYGDVLFLLSSDERVQPRTAEEIRGKKEERLLQLGGVFARISRELRKALQRMAAIAHRHGKLPPPPPALLSKKLNLQITFTNPLIAAQKAIGVTAASQLVSFGLAAAQAKQGGFDNLDARKATNKVADMLGVAPDFLFSDDEMAQQDQAKAAQANAQQQAESMPQAAGAIKDLSNADPDKLRSILQQFSPQAEAEAGPQQ